jgi:four helix bundle protein
LLHQQRSLCQQKTAGTRRAIADSTSSGLFHVLSWPTSAATKIGVSGLRSAAPKKGKPNMANQLQMYQVTLSLIGSLRATHATLKQHDKDQANQLKRATNSILSNIAEGSRRQGRDRIHHWLIAAGSADEVRSALEASVAWGDLSHEQVIAPLQLVDRIIAMLWRATHPGTR